MDFMKVYDQTVREIKREVNLKVLKVPEIEQKIQRLIHMLLENLSSLLESLVAINQTTKPQEASSCSIDDLIPSIPRLRILADMLDMPLKSITASWESGELANCGYTSSEVEDFFRTIFTDSPLRKNAYGELKVLDFRRVIISFFDA